MEQGYRVVPVNPNHPRILGETAYPSLSAVPEDVRLDIVDVFRRSDAVAPVAEEAIGHGGPPRIGRHRRGHGPLHPGGAREVRNRAQIEEFEPLNPRSLDGPRF